MFFIVPRLDCSAYQYALIYKRRTANGYLPVYCLYFDRVYGLSFGVGRVFLGVLFVAYWWVIAREW